MNFSAEKENGRGWRKASFQAESEWRMALPLAVESDLVGLARRLSESGGSLVDSALTGVDREAWWSAFEPVRESLERGAGLVIVEGPVSEPSMSESERTALYWVVGQLLGRPVAQNVAGVRLYDVRDTGQKVAEGARFSVTNAESTFHTDASFEDDVVDYVGLLCLNTAKSGGLSQLVSGYTVAQEIAAINLEALNVLSQPFQVDRRGGVRPGEAPTVARPVIVRYGDGWLFRYLRTWIETGHQKANVALSSEQIQALDLLDLVLCRDDLQVEFMLRPGDMFFINNRWTLHNRTAFEDHVEPDRKRHYVRLWLKAEAKSS